MAVNIDVFVAIEAKSSNVDSALAGIAAL